MLPLIHLRGGSTTPGQASRGCSPGREIPFALLAKRHVASTPRVSVSALPAFPVEVEWGCSSVARAPSSRTRQEVRDHGLTEQLLGIQDRSYSWQRFSRCTRLAEALDVPG